MNRFLAELDPAERVGIFTLAEQVSGRVQEWARPYGVFEAQRFATTGLTMAAAAPWVPVEALATMAALTLWIFTVDDWLDRGVLAPAERRARVGEYAAVAAGAGPPGRDPLARALCDIGRELAARPLWGALAPVWATACRAMLTGMVAECEAGERVRAGGAWPSLRTYMEHGVESIGVRLYLVGAWAVVGGPGTAARLPQLRRLARSAGRALRLANDLRTLPRERQEGNANVLLVLGRAGWPAEAAEAHVRQWAARCVRRTLAAAGRLAGEPAAALTARVCRFAVDFYDEHDFHTVPQGRIRAV